MQPRGSLLSHLTSPHLLDKKTGFPFSLSPPTTLCLPSLAPLLQKASTPVQGAGLETRGCPPGTGSWRLPSEDHSSSSRVGGTFSPPDRSDQTTAGTCRSGEKPCSQALLFPQEHACLHVERTFLFLASTLP